MSRFNFLTINVIKEQVKKKTFQVFLHREQINKKHLTRTMEETPSYSRSEAFKRFSLLALKNTAFGLCTVRKRSTVGPTQSANRRPDGGSGNGATRRRSSGRMMEPRRRHPPALKARLSVSTQRFNPAASLGILSQHLCSRGPQLRCQCHRKQQQTRPKNFKINPQRSASGRGVGWWADTEMTSKHKYRKVIEP